MILYNYTIKIYYNRIFVNYERPPYTKTMDLNQLPAHVRIMAVTKTVPAERIIPVLEQYRITLIGESRWQEARTKLPLLPRTIGEQRIEKHFVGHLQTNKVKEVVATFDAVESIDSQKLLLAVAHEADRQRRFPFHIFLQVNISRDQDKFGFLPEQVAAAVVQARSLPQLQLDGFMAITARESPEAVRANYKKMKQLQQQYDVRELSIGMSDDWPIAVAEGATIIRLGRALFGVRPVY